MSMKKNLIQGMTELGEMLAKLLSLILEVYYI